MDVQTKLETWEKEFCENYWLGLGDIRNHEVPNPLFTSDPDLIENPHVHLLSLLRKPENFFFTCKHLLGKTLAPFQLAILRELWKRPFPLLIGSRGLGKSWLLGVYSILRALFTQGSKVVIVGAGFRQARFVFDYARDIWNNSGALQELCSGQPDQGPRNETDRLTLRIGDSVIVALPLGTGEKIRGQRASHLIVEEKASLPEGICETVLEPFSSVSMDPIAGMQKQAVAEALKVLGRWTDAHQRVLEETQEINQMVLSGTAFYCFNHFYKDFIKYKKIIESHGDKSKLAEAFGGKLQKNINPGHYCVIRYPVELLPKGYMDEVNVAKAQATDPTGSFAREYGACWGNDSHGFFKRSLIEGCCVGRANPVLLHGAEVRFSCVLKGHPKRRYVMGVDPASESDNFAIVILELWPEHRRIVHCWTTRRDKFRQRVANKAAQEQDFYRYVGGKIRELCREFPCERIALDSQGGGVAVQEILRQEEGLLPGERIILPTIVEGEEKDTDYLVGNHILELIYFARSEWVCESNHGLRSDMMSRAILFPEFDSALLGATLEANKQAGLNREEEDIIFSPYDSLEDCMMEIEELKEELTTIVHTQTGIALRDRWDTPETKDPQGKKGRLRKDRYTALLMANMVGRQLANVPAVPDYQVRGKFAHEGGGEKKGGPAYHGPAWFLEQLGGVPYGTAVKRGTK